MFTLRRYAILQLIQPSRDDREEENWELLFQNERPQQRVPDNEANINLLHVFSTSSQ